ncbi:transposase [Nonomuraea sp. LP-02]|uniref:transposase n=1 Tax=Nonomuraea sp. LP-02 TaxID=3097960 RepID=UPI002E351619|nr:transposase [Nonomuraea sp. LP-02]MED7923949.1 transposase [Nonomuraea sp. LP-02]
MITACSCGNNGSPSPCMTRAGRSSRRCSSKATRHDRSLVKIGRWFPGSKLCSVCGAVADSMPLNVRSWACPCGAVHDRDVNAAKNILAAGRAERLNACGGTVKPAA